MSPPTEGKQAVSEQTCLNITDLNNNGVKLIDMNNNRETEKIASTPPLNYVKKVVLTSISKTNLYLRGLNENTTDNDLLDLCQR